MKYKDNGRHQNDLMVTALCIALVFLATRFVQIPIPLGYAHLGNALILLAAVWLGPVTGALAGGLGSALADLTSFPVWTLPTLIIKTVMGLVCGWIAYGSVRGGSGFRSIRGRRLRVLNAVIIAMTEMILGYTAAGSILYGSWATGLLQVPGLVGESAAGVIAFYVLAGALERTGVMNYVRRNQNRS